MVMSVGKPNLQMFQEEARKLMSDKLAQRSEKSGEHDKKSGTVSDRVSLGQQKPEEVTYDGSIKEFLDSKYSLLRDLVVNTLQEQGIATKVAAGESEIDISTLTPEQAKDLVSDDGYFGVKQTSDRMFEFAVQMAGTDPARMAEVRKGLEKGFKEAEKVFGGTLPDISYDTMDAVLEKLQKYEEENGMAFAGKESPWNPRG